MSSIEALVVEQPCVGVLDDRADDAESGLASITYPAMANVTGGGVVSVAPWETT